MDIKSNEEMGAVARWLRPQMYVDLWLRRRTADAEVPDSSPHHIMEELSRFPFSHCFTPPRCNGYLALGNLSDGTGSSSYTAAVDPVFRAEYSLGS